MLLGLIAVQAISADPLHAIADDAYQHHDSGWIFPLTIGEFTRVGAPQDLDGTSDALAYYERVVKGVRTTATVNVYPPASDAAEATKTADDELELESSVLTSADKSLEASDASVTATYLVDTGPWVVKIQSSGAADAVSVDALDDFVRSQRWDSLALAGNSCTSKACKNKGSSRTGAVAREQLQGSDCKVGADDCPR
jgi:hypothetical protein